MTATMQNSSIHTAVSCFPFQNKHNIPLQQLTYLFYYIPRYFPADYTLHPGVVSGLDMWAQHLHKKRHMHYYQFVNVQQSTWLDLHEKITAAETVK